jgi:Chaperone of endosialidase
MFQKAIKCFVLTMLSCATVHAQQHVGIGNSNPLMRLHVSDTGSATLLLDNEEVLATGISNGLYFKTGSYYTGAVKTIGDGTLTARMAFFTGAESSTAALVERLSIDNSGRIGIGTIQPQAPLHISAPGTALLLGDGSYTLSAGNHPEGAVLGSSGPLHLFANGNVNSLSLAPNGNISMVGAVYPNFPAAPNARLYLRGPGGVDGTLAIAGTMHTSHFHYGSNEDTYIRGGKNNSVVIISDLGGNVGIGTSSNLLSKLTVATGPTVTGIEHTNGTVRLGSYAGFGAAQNAYWGTLSNHPLYIMTNGVGNTVFYNGMLGVSTTINPTRPMHVFQNFGKALGITNFEGTNTWDMVHGTVFGTIPALIYTFNNTTKSGMRSDDGSYFTVSDKAAKTDVETMGPVLDKLMQLSAYRYHMLENPKEWRTGFISQEVQPLFPELVGLLQLPADSAGIDKKTLLAINYAGFSVIAVKAIQEQQQTIEALQAKVDKLQLLEQRLEKLEKKN